MPKGIINNVSNLEKAIFALEYLGQLQDVGLDFIFKGGSAVQILLGSKWNRLSVDIDICTNASEDELIHQMEKIFNKFDRKGFAYVKRREITSSIPFYLYKIETPSITENKRTIFPNGYICITNPF